jgi:hypothetical protein
MTSTAGRPKQAVVGFCRKTICQTINIPDTERRCSTPFDDAGLVVIATHRIEFEQSSFDLKHAVIHTLRDIVLFS